MDIFDELRRIQLEMDRLFRELMPSRELLPSPRLGTQDIMEYRHPATNIYETDNAVIAEFEVPGVDKNDIELNVTENEIELKIDKKLEKEVKKKGYYVYESKRHGFYRRLPLPTEVIPDKTKAELQNGILKVEMPKSQKTEDKKKKRINIK
ncbi:MAG: Hsp20/alpha crystallin family protein [Candidatus Woesearchaeota archaeon]